MLQAIADALKTAAFMGWEILWALVLGFFLSGAIQAVVSHREMARLLPDDGPRSIVKASLLGAASSSCSYAAVAIARSIFRKGGNFTAAMAFQFASTNLVAELGILMAILLGWRFTAATWSGGIIMIVLLVVLLRLLVRPNLVLAAKAALAKVEQMVLADHLGSCVEDAIVSGDPARQREKVAELIDVLGRSAR